MNTRMRLVLLLAISIASSLSFAGAPSPAKGECVKPWLYFDLGDTLVDTHEIDPKTKKPINVHYMPGALEYLRGLGAKGYSLGLISNVPANGTATPEEQYATLRKLVEEGWTDAEPMHWELFDLSALLPITAEQRKPAPYLFLKAGELAAKQGCWVLYQGETPAEIAAAKAAHLGGFQIRAIPPLFLEEQKFDQYRPTP